MTTRYGRTHSVCSYQPQLWCTHLKAGLQQHASQRDYATGFGGKYGVQSDRKDKSAVGWDHVEQVDKHDSQKDYKSGFGGQYGVQKDRVDKSAVGWDHVEDVEKHQSQKGVIGHPIVSIHRCIHLILRSLARS